MTPEFLRIDELAKSLSMSKRTVRRLADSGRMPRPIKLGHLIRWRRDEIETWAADGCPKVAG